MRSALMEVDHPRGNTMLSEFSSELPQENPTVEVRQDLPDFQSQKNCPTCGSDKVNTVLMPSYHPHYAALKCGQCDRFIKWQIHPANQEKQQRRQTTISQLLKSPQLIQWEREFLRGVKSKKLSLKQQEVLKRIEAKVGVNI